MVQALKAINKSILAGELQEKYGSVHAVLTDEEAQQLIDKAMKSGILKQRNVVGVITGLMGSGKTTLLHHLFGLSPPNVYTSTGVAEQSFRSFLHRIGHLSWEPWQVITYQGILDYLAPLIRAGMERADVESLATSLAQSTTQVAPYHNFFSGGSAIASDLVLPVSIAPQPPNMVLELIHMIDTGGQPELMEVMPSLIHNANLAVVVVDLRYGLHEQFPVSYHEEGIPYMREYPSHYTGRDIILKLVSTLHAKKHLHEDFHVITIATHRDCVENSSRMVDALNGELSTLLLPVFEDELIQCEPPQKIAFVLNLKNPSICDKIDLHVISRIIEKSCLRKAFDTPASFFAFEQDLLRYAKQAERDILSLEECKQVGARLRMSDEMVRAALIFFHRQNTFLYFQNVLPNHVFVNPQVPLDIVNNTVRLSYQKHATDTKSLKDGIITKQFLSEVSPHFKEGVYEVRNAIELFCHTFILAPLKPHTTGEKARAVNVRKKEYLMMCLKPTIPDCKLHDYIPKSSDKVPLIVKFSSDCVPLGCFSSTISCLLFKYGWEVLRQDDAPKCLAQNIASLYDPDLSVKIVLVDFNQYLEVHIDSDLSIHKSPADICCEVCKKVFCAVQNVLEVMEIDTDYIKVSEALVCSCTKVPGKHFAEFKSHKNKHFLCCEFSKDTVEPNDKELLWKGINKPRIQVLHQTGIASQAHEQHLHCHESEYYSSHQPPLAQAQLLNITLPSSTPHVVLPGPPASGPEISDTPKLEELLRFPKRDGGFINIAQYIEANYSTFGIFLLEDNNGAITDGIKATEGGNVDGINCRIMKKWLQGTGRTPRTWETFCTVLDMAELNSLAFIIRDNLRQPSHP